MSIVSCAQNFEDVLLWRALGHVEQGRYLDVGAQDPVVDSVSLAFYEAGWRGVHVEPTPFYAARLREARPDETVIEAAVTDKKGPITLYEIPDTGLSTGVEQVAATHLKSGFQNRPLVVPSIRLDGLLTMSKGDIHWMKIDVEGMEADVLRSWGNSPLRPWVLVIEATYPNSQKPTHKLWINEVLRRDYREVYFDGISRFFVHEAHKALAAHFDRPPNVFDGFGISSTHWVAREVERIYQERRATASSEASQREAELRQGVDVAQAQAAAATGSATTAVAERDQARDDALSAKIRLEAASSHHHKSLASLAVESNRMRSEASSASARLLEAERAHSQALVEQWREWRVVEAAFRAECRDREDNLQAALRDAATDAASTHLDLVEAHSAEVARLREVLAEVHNQADNDKRALREEFESKIHKAQANATALNVELGRHQERVAEIQSILDQAGEAERMAAEHHRAEREQLCSERDDARAEVEKIRVAAEHADALMRAVMVARSGLWHRIGEALGLARSPQLPDQRDDSFRNIPPRSPAASIARPSPESEPTMFSLAYSPSRNPYLAARSLAELLLWHDVNFVRCAFVTILGRQPDPQGEAYYIDRLRRGEPKLAVLRQLRNSSEGSKHDPGIAGLDRALNKGAVFRIWGLRWLARAEYSKTQSQRLLRAVGNVSEMLDRTSQMLTVALDQLNHHATSIADAERRRSEERIATSIRAPDELKPITITVERLLEIAGGD